MTSKPTAMQITAERLDERNVNLSDDERADLLRAIEACHLVQRLAEMDPIEFVEDCVDDPERGVIDGWWCKICRATWPLNTDGADSLPHPPNPDCLWLTARQLSEQADT